MPRRFDQYYRASEGGVAPPPGATHISFQAGALNGGTHSKKSLVETFAIEWPDRFNTFIRGNANAGDNLDQTIDLSDVIYTLEYLFINGSDPKCPDSADLNDDGRIDISDPVYLLFHLFTGGNPPRSPYPQKGFDPTKDNLSCWKEFESLCR